jgi:hypothetical protein
MGYTEVEETVKSQSTGRRSSSPELGSLPQRNFLSFLQFTLWMEQSLEGVGHARISHELADSAHSNYFQTSEEAQIRCGKEVDSFRRAFEVIKYPFDLSSTVLGREFCWDVRNVIEESQNETPRPKKWELCERILDKCEHTSSGVGIYSDVGPPYWPPDFDEHINRLFEREKNVKIERPLSRGQSKTSAGN